VFAFWTHQVRHGVTEYILFILYFLVVNSWYPPLCENAISLKTISALPSFSGSLFYGIPAERAVGSMGWISLLLLV
jgi:hypothetical protein